MNDKPEIPEAALQEAIVNAICHRDHFEKGGLVMIELFDDRLEISNPGGLPAGLTRSRLAPEALSEIR